MTATGGIAWAWPSTVHVVLEVLGRVDGPASDDVLLRRAVLATVAAAAGRFRPAWAGEWLLSVAEDMVPGLLDDLRRIAEDLDADEADELSTTHPPSHFNINQEEAQ